MDFLREKSARTNRRDSFTVSQTRALHPWPQSVFLLKSGEMNIRGKSEENQGTWDLPIADIKIWAI
jgi:hypothetical protein